MLFKAKLSTNHDPDPEGDDPDQDPNHEKQPGSDLKKITPSKFQNKREVLYIDFGQLVLQEKFAVSEILT